MRQQPNEFQKEIIERVSREVVGIIEGMAPEMDKRLALMTFCFTFAERMAAMFNAIGLKPEDREKIFTAVNLYMDGFDEVLGVELRNVVNDTGKKPIN